MQMDPTLPQARRLAMTTQGHWPDRLLLNDLDRWAEEAPGRIATVDHNAITGVTTTLTYAELQDRVDRIANGMIRLGIRKGDVVSVQLPNWWQFQALHLACLRIGAVTNPIMPIFRARELRFMLRHAGSKLMVVPKEFRGFDHLAMMKDLRADLPKLRHILAVGGSGDQDFSRLLDHPADRAARAVLIAQRPTPDDVVLLLYTSGTTGEPKGVMHTSNTLMAMVGPYSARFSLGVEDVMLMGSPLAHLTGFAYGLMMPVHMGGRAVFLDVWNGSRALDIIRDQGVTFTMGATPFVADLTEAASDRRDDARTLRGFLSAGAPIPRNLVRRATEILDAFIISAWGMTENGAATSTKPGDSAERVFETDGTPFPGLEIRAVGPSGEVLGAGLEGDLQIRGAANFVGYMGRPEAYDTDAEGWFKTGDLARIDVDGYVRITGRSKDVIIRGGENVPVVEVEGLIYQHPAIAECAVVAMPDERLGERGCCFAVLRPDARLTFAGLMAFLRENELSRTYLPERLEIIDTMPKTPSGKIQKNVLRERAKGFI